MLRVAILVLMAAAVGVLALPFAMTARAREERGVTVAGRVWQKSETVSVSYSTWRVERGVTVEYPIPDGRGTGFVAFAPAVAEYDSLAKGQEVAVKYLPRTELPRVPLASAFGQMGLLPVASVADRGWLPAGVMTVGKIAGAFVLLIVMWRVTRSRVFVWTMVAAVMAGIVWMLAGEFPRATAGPRVGVQRAAGVVKSVGQIGQLFEGSRTRGLDAAQPVDVVAVEFVPAGRTEPVVAVDLIDHGSTVREKGAVGVEYEAGSPRTAWIVGATRTFPGKNLRGAFGDAGIWLGVLVGGFVLWQWLAGRFRRLLDVKR